MAVSPVSSVSPDTSSPGSRFTWMDLFRGLAVVLVTANHAADESTSEAIRGVMAALGDYRMPALLLLSGILLPRSLTKPRWLLAEPSHVWYLDALLMYYLLGLLLRRVPPLVTALALLVLSVPLAVFSYPGDVPGMVWHRPWYGFFFFLGAALQPHLHRVIGLRGWVIALAALVSVPWVVHTVRVGETFNGGVVAALMSAVGLIVVVWLAPRVPRARVARAFEWMGRNSIVIYLVHFPSMFACHQIGFSADGVLNYLVMVALSLGAGVVAVRLRPWSWFLYEFPDLRARRRRRREAVAAAG